MIKADRVIIASSIPHQNVLIYTQSEQTEMGITNVFKNQLYIIDNLKRKFILDSKFVSDIQWKKMKYKNPNDIVKVKRLTCTWDQVGHCPAHVLKPEKHAEYGIDTSIFPDDELVFFTTDGYIHISSMENVLAIQI